MNYHTAAELLHLTQPAVTKQIQSLEAQYRTRLFSYDGKTLHKTEAGRVLEDYARSIRSNFREMKQAMAGIKRRTLRIGATKTIGLFYRFYFASFFIPCSTFFNSSSS